MFRTYSKTKASCDGHVSALGLCSELADQEDCDNDDTDDTEDIKCSEWNGNVVIELV